VAVRRSGVDGGGRRVDKVAAMADRTVDRLGMDRRLRDHRLDVAPAYPRRRGTYQGHIRSLGA